MAIKLQIRRGTASNWTSSNPTLESGEIGFETDTGNVKIGDGTTAWTSLGYVSSTYPQVAVSGTDINAAGYSVQGRYPIATTVTANIPAGWTALTDGPGVLHVTKLSGGTIAQLLVSTKTQKAFARGYDGSAWTTWVAVSQYAGSITVTELANDAVETAKIKSATGTSDGVTDAKLRQSTALTVIGRSANSTGAPADIAAGTDGHVLRRAGTALGFGTLASGAFDANTDVPLTALANIANNRLLGNVSGGSAIPAELTAANVQTFLGLGALAYLADIISIDLTTTDIVASSTNYDIDLTTLTVGRLSYFEGTVVLSATASGVRIVSESSERYVVLACNRTTGTGIITVAVTVPSVIIGAATTSMYTVNTTSAVASAGLLVLRLS
jgi:hypothetical protein